MSDVSDAISLSSFNYPSHQDNWSRFKILICLYFIVCVGWFAVRTAHWKQVNDPAQLHYLCFLMDHGMAPYRDLVYAGDSGQRTISLWPGLYQARFLASLRERTRRQLLLV